MVSEDPQSSGDQLQERLTALERTVSELQEEIRSLQDRVHSSSERRGGRPPRERSARPRPRPRDEKATGSLPKIDISTEEILKWSGIGLVLFAVVLIFKYAVDAGWLTPFVRVAVGFLIGTVLLILGFRLHEKRPRFGQVLQGGGIAAFYISLFAAFQVLDLIPYTAAFVGMASVTVVALTLGLWQDDAGLSVFGLIGGLATPFLLYTGEGDVPALISYACLLLSATTAIYFWKGWQSMLYVTVIGGWAVFFVSSSEVSRYSGFDEKLAVQLSAIFGLLAFWAAPVVRAVGKANPVDNEPVTSMQGTGVLARLETFFRNVVYFLVISTPLLALVLTGSAWDLSERLAGIVAAGEAALFIAVGAYLATIDRDTLAYVHYMAGALLFTTGLLLILDGDVLIVALAGEAAVLHILAKRLDDTWSRRAGHLLFFCVAVWLFARVQELGDTPPLVNMTALSDVVVIALSLAAAASLSHLRTRNFYHGLAYLAVLGWFARELGRFENGQGYVTVAWALCGIALLLVGMKRDELDVRRVGLATLLLVVGKLFVVDLAELDPLWRILLFMGVGAGFLVLGYFVPGLWKDSDQRAVNGEQ